MIFRVLLTLMVCCLGGIGGFMSYTEWEDAKGKWIVFAALVSLALCLWLVGALTLIWTLP